MRTVDRESLVMRLFGREIDISRIAAAGVLALALIVSTAARAGPALLFEPYKGTVLYEEDIDTPWHPASLTKLMTAYLTFQALRQGKVTMDDKLTCSPTAHKQAPTKLGLAVGSQVDVDFALRTLIVKSYNDIAVMLGEKVGGGSLPRFIDMMNETAGRLGMKQTRFVNPNGLPDDRQVTTARDMGLLARAIITEFPEYDWLFKLGYVRVGKRRFRSHNGLLRSYEGADGMKTGFVCASGFNIVASATRDGHRLVAVVLGGRTSGARNVRAAELLDHGFRRFRWKSLFAKTIDDVTVKASITEGAPNLRRKVCGRR
jgi:D-alanyl-D-alanine carboxypeptidase